jgi:hypothetical protein
MVVIVPQGNVFLNNQFIIFILIIIILQLRERKINPWQLFILPLFILLIFAQAIYPNILFTSSDIFILLGGYLFGTVLGIIVGKFYYVQFDENDEKIILKGSYLAVGLWIIIILMKVYGEGVLNSSGLIKLDLVVPLFLMITIGTMISRRAFIYWKYLKYKKQKKVYS